MKSKSGVLHGSILGPVRYINKLIMSKRATFTDDTASLAISANA